MRKISVFLFILILQNSLEASCLEYLAERDCTRYEPLFGIWEFTYDSGLVGLPQTDTFTLDRFNDDNCCYDNYYCGSCICGHDQHGAFTYVAYWPDDDYYVLEVVHRFNIDTHFFEFIFLDEDTVSGYRYYYDGQLHEGREFIGIKVQDFELDTTTTTIILTTTSSLPVSSTIRPTTTVVPPPRSTSTSTAKMTSTSSTSSIYTTTTIISSTTTTKPVPVPTTVSSSILTTTSSFFDLCVIEQIYGEGSKEAELFRYFRDTLLSQTPEGQEIIRLYYELSPTIVRMMEEDEVFKQEMKEMIDGILGI